MRPNRLIVRAYLARATKLWLLSRILMTGIFILAGVDLLRLTVVAFVELILLVVVIGFLDTRRHRERALLDNLGVSPFALGALFAGPALVGEIVLRIGVAVLA